MYIPDFDPDSKVSPVEIRTPVLPWIEASEATKAQAVEADVPVCQTLFRVTLIPKYSQR
jgi:hypothetical protein